MTSAKRELYMCPNCEKETLIEYILVENQQELDDFFQRFASQLQDFQNNRWFGPGKCKACKQKYRRPILGKSHFFGKMPQQAQPPVEAPVKEQPRAKTKSPPPKPKSAPKPRKQSSFSTNKIRKEDLSQEKQGKISRLYVLLVDKSFSMLRKDGDGGLRGDRWGAAEDLVTGLIDAVFEYSIGHQLPCYLFGSDVQTVGDLTNKHEVLQLFQESSPEGSTNLAEALDLALDQNIKRMKLSKEIPGVTLIVLTDGQPDSEADVKAILEKYANPAYGHILNPEEISILFIQIGDDPGATAFLQEMNQGFYFDGKTVKLCSMKTKDEVKKIGVYKLLYDAVFSKS